MGRSPGRSLIWRGERVESDGGADETTGWWSEGQGHFIVVWQPKLRAGALDGCPKEETHDPCHWPTETGACGERGSARRMACIGQKDEIDKIANPTPKNRGSCCRISTSSPSGPCALCNLLGLAQGCSAAGAYMVMLLVILVLRRDS